MNTHQWYLAGLKKIIVDLSTNTYIGGVASTISTASLLATKLGISVGAISNFTVVGSDIKCKITGSYVFPDAVFYTDTNITYYRDLDRLCTSINRVNFGNCTNLTELKLYGVTSITNVNSFFLTTKLSLLDFPNLLSTNTTVSAFANASGGPKKDIYIPNCLTLGTTVGNNLTFENIASGSILYVHPSLATNNGGAPDGDLTYAISQGAIVRYVTNFTAPNPTTSLSAVTIYNTAIQLNFTAPSSTNAIDYYNLYNNGVFLQKMTSSQMIYGLNPNTFYVFTVEAVDIYFNKSLISNSVSVSTINTMTDTDAISYMKSSENITYEVECDSFFTSLKTNSLYVKCQAIYPFLGITAANHKWNAKNPLDTNAAFRLTFSGGATFSNNGYTPNGSTGYANSNFTPSIVQNINSNGLTIVVGSNNAAASGNVVEIGSYNGASQASYLMAKNNNSNYKKRSALNSETPECSQSGINESRGILTGVRQSAVLSKLFKEGVQIATSTAGGTLPSLPIFIGALNAGSPVTFSNQRIQTVIFHEGLSDSEVATLHTVINTFENALGRKTW